MTAALVVLLYLIALPTLSLYLSKGHHDDPSRGHRDLPAWAICLSIVATETSTLTVVSIPGVAYGGSFVFVGMALGYLIGRIIVAWRFLPLFHNRDMASAYQYLGQRFGSHVQRLISASFLVTRLLAESVRLFAGMLPITALCAASGFPIGGPFLMVLIMILTLSYTMLGGLRAVVWSDSIQLLLYLGSALICIVLLSHQVSLSQALAGAHLFAWGHPAFTSPFTPAAAIIGGTLLTLASHGTDQLMIQRCLAAKSLSAARGAMIGSAFLVGLLFAALSLVGVMLHAQHHGAPLSQPDTLFPNFILTLPPILCGLLVASILAATMGSLSSAMNAMTGAIMGDFAPYLRRFALAPIALSRRITAFWALALLATTFGFSGIHGSAVIFAFSITSYCYGAVLGVFLLAMLRPHATSRAALTAFFTSLAILGVLSQLRIEGAPIAFSWLVPAGALSGLLAGRVSEFFVER
ncbi:sodium:solute symporter [Kozakia baliensis]|uniref:sodium:solute symporter n=1 Tax=Kozakia baliensis TaxID=153496 RepID=UPI00087B9F6D|nr:sodium:solute symporter [Kozakia baliensis]AOX19045.1 hypothetical protein A0U90_00595 [Kozakia baliensis]